MKKIRISVTYGLYHVRVSIFVGRLCEVSTAKFCASETTWRQTHLNEQARLVREAIRGARVRWWEFLFGFERARNAFLTQLRDEGMTYDNP